MNVKNTATTINLICLVSIVLPVLAEMSGEWSTAGIIAIFILLPVLTYGAGIVNLILAIKTKTISACFINCLGAAGFAAWFWYVQIDMHKHPDAQSPILYAFITPYSLIGMIPLWMIWSYVNKSKCKLSAQQAP